MSRVKEICAGNQDYTMKELMEIANSAGITNYSKKKKEILCKEIAEALNIVMDTIEETEIPDGMMDPVSHVPLFNPVVLSDGFSYSVQTAKELFKRKLDSPMTREPFDQNIVIPNWNLKKVVLRWLAEQNREDEIEEESQVDYYQIARDRLFRHLITPDHEYYYLFQALVDSPVSPAVLINRRIFKLFQGTDHTGLSPDEIEQLERAQYSSYLFFNAGADGKELSISGEYFTGITYEDLFYKSFIPDTTDRQTLLAEFAHFMYEVLEGIGTFFSEQHFITNQEFLDAYAVMLKSRDLNKRR